MQPIDLKIAVPDLPFLNLSSIMNGRIILIIFVVFLVGYCVVSGVLMYHWSRYGMHTHHIKRARLVFILVSALLFLVSALTMTFV